MKRGASKKVKHRCVARVLSVDQAERPSQFLGTSWAAVLYM